MKLIKIYEHLKMHSQVTPILTEEYQYICLNKFYFKNGSQDLMQNLSAKAGSLRIIPHW
jgi:hypothetical protein